MSSFLQAAIGAVKNSGTEQPAQPKVPEEPKEPKEPEEPLRSQKAMIEENKPFMSAGIPMNFQFVWRVARRGDPTMTKKKCINNEMVIERWKCTETKLAENSDVHTNYTDAFLEVYDYYININGAPPVSPEVFTLPQRSTGDTVMYSFYEAVKCVAQARKLQNEAAKPQVAGVRMQLLLKQMQAYFTKARGSLFRFVQKSQMTNTGFKLKSQTDRAAVGRVQKPNV